MFIGIEAAEEALVITSGDLGQLGKHAAPGGLRESNWARLSSGFAARAIRFLRVKLPSTLETAPRVRPGASAGSPGVVSFRSWMRRRARNRDLPGLQQPRERSRHMAGDEAQPVSQVIFQAGQGDDVRKCTS